MKIDWYTLMFNEQDIIPYVIDYWERLMECGIDLHVIIYDNESMDDSVRILSRYGWIEVRSFHTVGMNDIVHAEIKNNCWKDSKGKADFVVVADFDEILWGNLSEELQAMKDGGCNVMGTKWYAFCGDKMPEYTKGKYLHQLVKYGYRQHINHMDEYAYLGKFMVIDPNKTETMNWSVGNHICDPKPKMDLYESAQVVAFHINKGLSEDNFVKRRQYLNKRLSTTNRIYGMCVEYGYTEEAIRNEYRDYRKNAVYIADL